MGDSGGTVCPTCGAAAEPNQRFCRACGKPLGGAARQPAVGQTVSRPPDPRAPKIQQQAVPAPTQNPAAHPIRPRVEPIDLALPPSPMPSARRAVATTPMLSGVAVVLFIGFMAGAYRFVILPTLQTAQRQKEKSLAQMCERAAMAELAQKD